jgi:hypothetical protein
MEEAKCMAISGPLALILQLQNKDANDVLLSIKKRVGGPRKR